MIKVRNFIDQVILQFVLLRWRYISSLHRTEMMSPKKDETAVRSCDPALSVLVMSVSRNVFHVMHQSIPAVPIQPPPPANPRAIALFK